VPEVPYRAFPTVEPSENIPFRPFEPKVSAATFGGLIAKGVGEAGSEISQVGERWGKIQVDAQINKALKEGDDAVNGLRTLQGQDAINYSNDLQDRLEEIITRNGQGLTAEQQHAYESAVRPYQYRLWNGEIVTTQKRAQLTVSKSISDDTITHGTDLAARFAGNVDGPDFQNALNKVKSGYRQQVIDAGNANVPGALDAADSMATMVTYQAAAERLAATDKYKALQFTQKYEKELGAAATPLEAKFKAAADKERDELGSDAISKVFAAPPEQRAALARQYESLLPPAVFRALTTPQPVPATPVPRREGESMADYYRRQESRAAAATQTTATQTTATTGPNPAATIQIESSGRPQYGGHYQGLGQFDEHEQKRFGITDPNNRQQVETALRLEANENRPALTTALGGREPTASDYYLAHQQGIGGAVSHLTHPDQLAWESMHQTTEGRIKGAGWAKRAVWGNMTKEMQKQFPGGVDTVTSRDFMRLWDARYARAATQVAGTE
jgi:hypothetical protein